MHSLTPAQWLDVVRSQANRIETLEQRLAWFERQIFGSKASGCRFWRTLGSCSWLR